MDTYIPLSEYDIEQVCPDCGNVPTGIDRIHANLTAVGHQHVKLTCHWCNHSWNIFPKEIKTEEIKVYEPVAALKAWIFSHPGVWLTAYTCVIATSLPAAKRQFKHMLKKSELAEKPRSKDPDPQIKELDLTKPGATMIWNGDY